MCPHSLPANSSYYHCASCCATYTALWMFDEHRDGGHCHNLDGVYEDGGVYSTVDGHARRRELSARFSRMWETKREERGD